MMRGDKIMNETLDTIKKRTSCRNYQDKALDSETLMTILNAGIQAPSAMNQQLCEVFAVTRKDYIDELASAIRYVFNERGETKSDDYHCAYHAPVLVIVAGPEYDSKRIEDGSCMLENMFLAATSLNIGSCWINQLRDTQDVEEVRHVITKMGIPTNFQVIGCAALGYSAADTPAKEKKQTRIHIIEEKNCD